MRWDAAVVLAGGQSSRMGTEKAVLQAGGRTLVERLLGILAPCFERLFVSVARSGPSPALRQAMERAARDSRQEVVVIKDRLEASGPLAGVEAALETLPVPSALFLGVDAPHVTLPLVSALWKEVSSPGCLGCIPRWSQGPEPAFAVYSKGLLPEVRKLLRLGPRSLQALLRSEGVRVLDLENAMVAERVFGPSPPLLSDLFRSLNTPEEFEAWKQRVAP